MKGKKTPDMEMAAKPIPTVGKAENTVTVNGIPKEIKPTKLRYIRNGTANLYRLIENVSLVDILTLQSGAFGEDDDRDGDKAVMDFLIAVFDDEQFVVDNYDDFDTNHIWQAIEIFKRVNKFVETDAKNGQTPREEA